SSRGARHWALAANRAIKAMKSSRKFAASWGGRISRGWAYRSRTERTLRTPGFPFGAIHGYQTSQTLMRTTHDRAEFQNSISFGLGPCPIGTSNSWGGRSAKNQMSSIPRSFDLLAKLEPGAVIVAKSWRITGSTLLATKGGGRGEHRFI